MSTGMQLERSEVKMSGYYNNWSVSDMDKYVKVPLSDEDARSLKSGDYVYLTGTILYSPGCGAQENAGSSGQGRSTSNRNEK
mgnify:CR=1 FL=1